MSMRDRRMSGAQMEVSYILVHQAGLADTTVTEDDDLPTLAGNRPLIPSTYLEENLLPGSHCVYRVGVSGVGCRINATD